MNKSTATYLVLVLMLHASTTVLAQDTSLLFTSVERAVKEKEPDWKLVKKRAYINSKSVLYEWRSGKSFVGVLISAHATSAKATKTYQGLPFDFEVVGLKITVLQAKVPNLGDENYVWKDSNDRKIFGVDFRKGNVVVHVSAPSIEIAKRFASHIADEIPAS